MAVYFATKAYVLSFTEALHEELKPHGVKVSALCPGPDAHRVRRCRGHQVARPVRPARDGSGARRSRGPGGPRQQQGRRDSRSHEQGRRLVDPLRAALGRSADRRVAQVLEGVFFDDLQPHIEPNQAAAVTLAARKRRKVEWPIPTPLNGPPRRACRSRTSRRRTAAAASPGFPLNLMKSLGINEGDVIEIIGKRTTTARALRPYPDDAGLDIIRLDGLQRSNAARRLGRLCRGEEGAVEAGHASRVRARAGQYPPAGLGRTP